ncbi:hypothetical protein [Streptomyces sp. NPDC093097]|uniref:hypothetical protein n=1 Tax=Streptomyces sp. NPDC093097 TaxID=3366027 RepID=UPI00382213BC
MPAAALGAHEPAQHPTPRGWAGPTVRTVTGGVGGIGGLIAVRSGTIPWWALLILCTLALATMAIRAVLPQESRHRRDVVLHYLSHRRQMYRLRHMTAPHPQHQPPTDIDEEETPDTPVHERAHAPRADVPRRAEKDRADSPTPRTSPSEHPRRRRRSGQRRRPPRRRPRDQPG